MASEGSILDLIGAIYDAAIRPELWPEVTRNCIKLLGANMGALAIVDLARQQNDVFEPLQLDASLVPVYENHFVDKDVWLLSAAHALENASFIGSALVPTEELVKTEFYNEILRPQDIRYIACNHFHKTTETISYLSAYRTDRQGDFTQHELEILNTIGPHLKRAGQLHLKFAEVTARRDILSGMLDQVAVGMILVDSTSKILATNRIADELVAENDGLSVAPDGLRATMNGLTAALDALIADAIAAGSGNGMGAGGALAVARPSAMRPLEVLVAPLNARSEFTTFAAAGRRPTAVIFVRDPEFEPRLPAEILSQLYGLTPAEARLAVALAGGKPLKDYAEAAEITVGTARWTLKQVMDKTDTRRQSELVRLLSRSVARLAAAGAGHGE